MTRMFSFPILKRVLLTVALVGLALFLSEEPDYTPTAIVGTHATVLPRIVVPQNVPLTVGLSKSSYSTREVDISMSADGVVFVLRGSAAGFWCGRTWGEIKTILPESETLDDFFERYEHQQVPFLYVRRIRGNGAHFARRLSSLLRARGWQNAVIVGSSNPMFLIFMRLEARDIMLNYVLDRAEDSDPGFIKRMWSNHFIQKQVRRIVRPDIVSVYSRKAAKKFLALGYPVVLRDVEDETALRKMQESPYGIVHINKIRMLDLVSVKRYVSDAGGNFCRVSRVFRIIKEKDITDALQYARKNKLQVSIGGVRHSMGGHSIGDNMVYLDMTGLNDVTYNPETQCVSVGAGASWGQIQRVLDKHGRAVHIMQSDIPFSVGGSVSVNAHGWQVGQPPLVSDVRSLRLIKADGTAHNLSPEQQSNLFAAVAGGYGQLGVISRVELRTVQNSQLSFDYSEVASEDFAAVYKSKITANPRVELAYARVNVEPSSSMFGKIGLFWYERAKDAAIEPIQQERFVALKRAILREAIFGDYGKKMRWIAEKAYAKVMRGSAMSRNTAMCSDVHVIPSLHGMYNTLQEYFVPKEKINVFLRTLKELVEEYGINIINITIREVRADTQTSLPYARKNMFSLVLLIVHRSIDDAFKEFTQMVVDRALTFGGTFYLPYRTHATCRQMLDGYPNMRKWWELKKKHDPNNLFSSQFMQELERCLVTAA